MIKAEQDFIPPMKGTDAGGSRFENLHRHIGADLYLWKKVRKDGRQYQLFLHCVNKHRINKGLSIQTVYPEYRENPFDVQLSQPSVESFLQLCAGIVHYGVNEILLRTKELKTEPVIRDVEKMERWRFRINHNKQRLDAVDELNARKELLPTFRIFWKDLTKRKYKQRIKGISEEELTRLVEEIDKNKLNDNQLATMFTVAHGAMNIGLEEYYKLLEAGQDKIIKSMHPDVE